mmetsp:Transcript_40299/g.74911  ORF Transcript_40299/g.74911 Transcript_40299/m.74911 type:complete len:227 (-) Transcript_40299:46-726(-)
MSASQLKGERSPHPAKVVLLPQPLGPKTAPKQLPCNGGFVAAATGSMSNTLFVSPVNSNSNAFAASWQAASFGTLHRSSVLSPASEITFSLALESSEAQSRSTLPSSSSPSFHPKSPFVRPNFPKPRKSKEIMGCRPAPGCNSFKTSSLVSAVMTKSAHKNGTQEIFEVATRTLRKACRRTKRAKEDAMLQAVVSSTTAAKLSIIASLPSPSANSTLEASPLLNIA